MANLSNASFNQLCRFRSDHANWKDFSLLTDSTTVWLTEQAAGESPKQKIEIPRGIFKRLVREYLRERRFVRG